MKLRPRITTFLALLPLCLLLIYLMPQSIFTRDDKVRNDYAVVLTNRWALQKFISPTNQNQLNDFIERIPCSGEKPLSEERRRLMYEAIRNLIKAYSSGQFSDFLRFRTPIGARYLSNRIEVVRSFLIDEYHIAPSLDAESVFKLYIEKQSGGDFYQEYWRGIGENSAKIWVEVTNAMPAGLLTFANTQETLLGVYTPSPTFVLDETPRGILQTDGQIEFFTVMFHTQLKSPDPITPFLARFYWSERNKLWLPWEIAVSNGWKETVIEPVF